MEDKLSYLPEEMRDAQEKYNGALRRKFRAKEQLRLWEIEFDNARADFLGVEAWYGTVTSRWNPSSNTMDPMSDHKLEQFK